MKWRATDTFMSGPWGFGLTVIAVGVIGGTVATTIFPPPSRTPVSVADVQGIARRLGSLGCGMWSTDGGVMIFGNGNVHAWVRVCSGTEYRATGSSIEDVLAKLAEQSPAISVSLADRGR